MTLNIEEVRSRIKSGEGIKRIKALGITGADLWAAGRHMAEWAETKRIGCAQYVPETNVINLYIHSRYHDSDIVYEVDLDRCATPAELVDWMFHLSGKAWCEGSVLTDFILCLEFAIECHHGVGVYDYFLSAQEAKQPDRG